MIIERKELVEDFIVISETGYSENETVSEGLIAEDYIGFVYYEKGSARIFDTSGRELSDKKPCHWSVFFVAKHHGNIVRVIPKCTELSKLTILYPVRYIRRKFNATDAVTNAWLRLLHSEDAFVSISEKVATEDLVSPVLKILGCSYTGSDRTLFVESQCLEILSLMKIRLSASNPHEVLSAQEIEKLERVQKILIQQFQNPPTLKVISKEVGLNLLKLKTGFKKMFGKPPYAMVREFRLNYAHAKLRTGNYTVAEVAELVGYESTTSFSNAFLAQFKIRPKALK